MLAGGPCRSPTKRGSSLPTAVTEEERRGTSDGDLVLVSVWSRARWRPHRGGGHGRAGQIRRSRPRGEGDVRKEGEDEGPGQPDQVNCTSGASGLGREPECLGRGLFCRWLGWSCSGRGLQCPRERERERGRVAFGSGYSRRSRCPIRGRWVLTIQNARFTLRRIHDTSLPSVFIRTLGKAFKIHFSTFFFFSFFSFLSIL